MNIRRTIPLRLTRLTTRNTTITIRMVYRLSTKRQSTRNRTTDPLNLARRVNTRFNPRTFRRRRISTTKRKGVFVTSNTRRVTRYLLIHQATVQGRRPLMKGRRRLTKRQDRRHSQTYRAKATRRVTRRTTQLRINSKGTHALQPKAMNFRLAKRCSTRPTIKFTHRGGHFTFTVTTRGNARLDRRNLRLFENRAVRWENKTWRQGGIFRRGSIKGVQLPATLLRFHYAHGNVFSSVVMGLSPRDG